MEQSYIRPNQKNGWTRFTQSFCLSEMGEKANWQFIDGKYGFQTADWKPSLWIIWGTID